MYLHLSPSRLSATSRFLQQAASMPAPPTPHPSAHKTLTPTPVQPPQVDAPPGDPALVQAYIGAVQRKVEGHRPGLIKVPAQTVLGQWLELHRSQLEHPIIQGWMREQKIGPSSLSIVPSTGAMSAKVDGVRKDFSLSDGTGWGQVSGPLLASGKVIAPGVGQELRIRSNENTVDVSAKVVAGFYGMQVPANLSEGRAQIRRLEHSKSFEAIPPDDRLRPANLRSAQALDLQRSNTEQSYSATPQKLAFTRLATEVANAYPNVHNEAKRWAGELIEKETGQKNVDPDSLYFNRFYQAQSASPGTATGAMHLGEEPFYSKRLPDALLDNFSEQDQIPGQLDTEAGIYKTGRGESTKGGYGAHNQFPLAPSTLMHGSWKTDFQSRMSTKINEFWSAKGGDYRTTLKGQFIQQAREQLSGYDAKTPLEKKLMPAEHQFTRDDYRLVMKAASNIAQDENAPLTVAQLQTDAPAKDQLRAYPFDINGWGSSDIIRFAVLDDGQYNYQNNRRDGTQILYIPGATPAFLRFASLDKMDEWVVDQAKDPKKREALASHFSLYNRQDGGAFGKFGVDSSLAHLGNGDWSKMEGETIDRNYKRIEGDVFSQMKDQAKERMISDADIAIKSNSEVTRDTWLNDISAAAKLFAPMAPIAAPVAAAAAALGVTELALGAEKSASGDTQAERSDGAWKAFDGALNTLFSAGGGGKAEDPFAIPRENMTTLPGQATSINALEGRAGRGLPNSLQPSQAGNISGHAVVDGDHLIANSTPNAKGIYQAKDVNGADQWLIRHTDDTGVSKVYEIRGDFKLSDNYVQIIDPISRKPVMTVHSNGDGEWVRVGGQAGRPKWPWQRTISPTPSEEIKPTPGFANHFHNLDGSKINEAEKFDQFLNVNEKINYDFSSNNYEEAGVIKRKLNVSWSDNVDNFTVATSEKAKPTEFGSSDYSDQFITDLNRNPYTLRVNGKQVEINIPKQIKALNFPGNNVPQSEMNALIKQAIQQFEQIVPEPALRARISEVAHQGATAPAWGEVQAGLKDDYMSTGTDRHFYIDYDPATQSATVTANIDFTVTDVSGSDFKLVNGTSARASRVFKISESNELDGDGLSIDKSAPTRIEVSVM